MSGIGRNIVYIVYVKVILILIRGGVPSLRGKYFNIGIFRRKVSKYEKLMVEVYVCAII